MEQIQPQPQTQIWQLKLRLLHLIITKGKSKEDQLDL